MLCNGMYVEDVEDGVCGFYTTLYTEYRSDVEGVEDPPSVLDLSSTSSTCFNIQCLMVWLKSSKSQLLKTFCGLKIS